MKPRSSLFAAVIFLGLTTSAAHGGSLATPLVITNGTDFPICVATNVGTSDATVTVVFKDGGGNVVTPIALSCGTTPHTLAPGAYCFNRFAAGADGHCEVSGNGKLRAALEIYDSGFLTKVVVPATK